MSPKLPRISVVTIVYNRAQTIASAIESVLNQSSDSIEYIVVDGMSNDGTDAVVNEYRDQISHVIREPDHGLYDAINKGIMAATGDIVGFVHADDMLAGTNVISDIQKQFLNGNFDAVYGDLVYVDVDNPDKVIRYWKSGPYNRQKFRRGWMPPHPTVYIRKSIYEQFGMYRDDLGSAADYECLVRMMYKHRLRVGYVPEVLVKMRVGGASNASIKNRLISNRDDRLAWIENGLTPPLGLRWTKPLSKLSQYFVRPPSAGREPIR